MKTFAIGTLKILALVWSFFLFVGGGSKIAFALASEAIPFSLALGVTVFLIGASAFAFSTMKILGLDKA